MTGSIWQHLFNELGFKCGAEIGVEQGKYAEVLCSSNPDAKYYAVDPWLHYRSYRDHVNQEKLEGFYEATRERIRKYDSEIIREFSVDAAKHFKDGQLDWVYIDGNHTLPYIVKDLEAWVPKVRKGGIVSGHDYIKNKNGNNHVVQAVCAWVDSYSVAPWFLLGARAKIDGEKRDRNRSFMWVKK